MSTQQIGHFDVPNSPITKGVQSLIQRGPLKRPQKVVIYGPEGVGKSTLASQFPRPLIVDVEGSTHQLNVDRISPRSYDEALNFLNDFAEDSLGYKTLVIDTIDWLELKIQQKLCMDNRHTSIEDFGYGKGYTHLSEEVFRLLNNLTFFIEQGLNVVLVGHSIQTKCELPDQRGQFDQWTLDLHKKVCPIVKEWADMMLFINWETKLVDDVGDKKGDNPNKKAIGGRVGKIYTTHSATFDAKNRHGLADVLPLDYASIAHIFEDAPTANKSFTATTASSLPSVNGKSTNAAKTEAEQEAELRVVAERGEKFLQENKIKGFKDEKALRATRKKIANAELTTGMTIGELTRYIAHLDEVAESVPQEAV